MAPEREFEGATLEDALQSAAKALGIREADVSYRILEVGRRGLFGIGARQVRIRVEAEGGSRPPARPESATRAESPAQPKSTKPRRRRSGRRKNVRSAPVQAGANPGSDRPEGEPRTARRTTPEPVLQDVEAGLGRMLELLPLDLRVVGRDGDSGLRLELGGEDRELLLRKDAELLSALQFLMNRMARRAWPDAGRIQLWCDGYRSPRDEELVALAREVAGQVGRTGRSKKLHPMNPYERRLVHLTIRDEFEGLTSHSEGDGFLKKIRISRNR